MSLILGIDVGTTSVKVSCIQGDKVLQKATLPYHQHLESDDIICSDKDYLNSLLVTGECNSFLILGALVSCLKKLDKALRRQVDAIAVCGQMHGCLYYSEEVLKQIRSIQSNGALQFNLKFGRDDQKRVSNLFTWEDQRCDEAFLNGLPNNSNKNKRLAYTGYATATTFWFLKNDPKFLKNFHFMGSFMDFFIHLILPDLKHPFTSNQLANSFGYFDMKTNCWSNFLYDARFEFPTHFLPTVLDDKQIAGRLEYEFMQLKPGTPVFVAYGDLQCAIYSAMFNFRTSRAAILNSGTSIQLAFPLAKKDFEQIRTEDLPNFFASKIDLPIDQSTDAVANKCIHLEILPYFNGEYLATSNSLNGGNVVVFFIKSIAKIVKDLIAEDFELSEQQIWSKISSLTKASIELRKSSQGASQKENDMPNIVPRLYGERFEEAKSKFSINSISANNFELGQLYHSLCSSILNNIFDGMCPIKLLKQLDINKLIAVGSTITNNEILRLCLEEKMNNAKLELVYEKDAEADTGACLWVGQLLKSANDLHQNSGTVPI